MNFTNFESFKQVILNDFEGNAIIALLSINYYFMRIPKRKSEEKIDRSIDPYITQKKYDEYEKELEKKIKIIRPKLIHEVQEHAKLGDFSENAAYQIAKGKLRGLNHRLLVLENLLKKAIIINEKNTSEVVELGSQVKIEHNGSEFVYEILGSQEVDLDQGIISHLSPIGSALIGHKVGDEVEVEVNDRVIKYKIIKVK